MVKFDAAMQPPSHCIGSSMSGTKTVLNSKNRDSKTQKTSSFSFFISQWNDRHTAVTSKTKTLLRCCFQIVMFFTIFSSWYVVSRVPHTWPPHRKVGVFMRSKLECSFFLEMKLWTNEIKHSRVAPGGSPNKIQSRGTQLYTNFSRGADGHTKRSRNGKADGCSVLALSSFSGCPHTPYFLYCWK